MSYRIFYPEIPNMGDLLNKCMIEELFGIDVTRGDLRSCNLLAIGSGLDHIMYADDRKTRIRQKIKYMFSDNVHIWSTGFIRGESETKKELIYKHVHIHALRGKLTLKRMESQLGKRLDVPTGDGGLLAQKWLGYFPEKEYEVGIIPHFKEQHHPMVKALLENYDAAFIDLTQEPKKVVEEIGKCKYVISSSLHGMIVADSFHVPNIHITLANSMFGDGNKFADYLSAFDLSHIPFDCAGGDMPTLKEIEANYKIDPDVVEKKKEQLMDSFPKL